MKYLLDKDGVRALEAFCMAETLFAFDYDGTLAPIVDDPRKAKMRLKTSNLLCDIATLVPVALISGRSRQDVAQFVSCKVDYVVGNHGLEGIPGGSPSLEQAESACRAWNARLQSEISIEGVVIEDKRYSLALHYRMAQDKRQAKAVLLETASALMPPPRIVMGKCVVNLISPGAPHKGIALLEVMLRSGSRSAVYFGDDDNDEDVFRLGEENLLTVRIGRSDHSAALFYLNSQDEMDQVLRLCWGAMVKAGKNPREYVYGHLEGGSAKDG